MADLQQPTEWQDFLAMTALGTGRACGPIVACVLQAAFRNQGPDLSPGRSKLFVSIEPEGASARALGSTGRGILGLEQEMGSGPRLASAARARGTPGPPACPLRLRCPPRGESAVGRRRRRARSGCRRGPCARTRGSPRRPPAGAHRSRVLCSGDASTVFEILGPWQGAGSARGPGATVPSPTTARRSAAAPPATNVERPPRKGRGPETTKLAKA